MHGAVGGIIGKVSRQRLLVDLRRGALRHGLVKEAADSVPHQAAVDRPVMGGKTHLGKAMVGSGGDIPQGVEKGAVQIKENRFGFHGAPPYTESSGCSSLRTAW